MSAAFPQVHAIILILSAMGAIVGGAVILARHARTLGARLHFVYACGLAWWWIGMAIVATADSTAEAQLWSRVLHLGVGMLPGITFHLNVALAGLEDRFRTRVWIHWAISVVLTLLALFLPGFFLEPSAYPWGLYPRYSPWGLLIVAHVLVVMPGIVQVFRTSMKVDDPRTARHQKGRTYAVANAVALLASLDFVAAFGVPVYPPGYLIALGVMGLVLHGSYRHRLVEFTPEYAAEHVLQEMPEALVVVDTRGMIQVMNTSAAELLGGDPTRLEAVALTDLDPPPELTELLGSEPSDGTTREITVGEGAALRHLKVVVSRLADQHEFPIATLFLIHDVTDARRALEEREQLEESVRHAQKLESLGVMASGIAHDFNNILLSILGNAEFAADKAAHAPDVVAHLEKIESAAERAAELTGQMLTYTGNRPTSRRPIDLNELIEGLSGLMGAAISKKVELRLDLDAAIPQILGDSGQMSQVVMNLITNAAEALEGEAGVVMLRTRLETPDASFDAWQDESTPVGADPYVLLEVEDTGAGMDGETRARIFDPFFSTKFTGRGLGLATVLGIVRAHRGLTRVESSPGGGTRFTIALPPTNGSQNGHPRDEPARTQRARGARTVLIADDEPQVLEIARTILSDAGFEVVTATDGRDAVEAFRARPGDIDVVVLDRTMPRLDGREAFAILRAIAPEVPIVFMSGYTDVIEEGLDPHTVLLNKPFRAARLKEKVREVLAG